MKIKIAFICILFFLVFNIFGESFIDSSFSFGLHYDKSQLTLIGISRETYSIIITLQSQDKQMVVVLRADEKEFESFLPDSFGLHTMEVTVDSLFMVEKSDRIEFRGNPSLRFNGYSKSIKKQITYGIKIIGRQVDYKIFVSGLAGKKNDIHVLFSRFMDSLEIFNDYIPYKKRKHIKEYMVVEAAGDSVMVNSTFAGRIKDIVNYPKPKGKNPIFSKEILPSFAKSLSQDRHNKILLLVSDQLPYFRLYMIMRRIMDHDPGHQDFIIDNIGSQRRNVFNSNLCRYGKGKDNNPDLPPSITCIDNEVSLSLMDSGEPFWTGKYINTIGEISPILSKKLESIALEHKTASNLNDIFFAAGNNVQSHEVIELMHIAKSAGFINVGLALMYQ
jgi:hypothetical protein